MDRHRHTTTVAQMVAWCCNTKIVGSIPTGVTYTEMYAQTTVNRYGLKCQLKGIYYVITHSDTIVFTVYLILCCCVVQVKAGFMLNMIGILTINLGINTWGDAMFQLSTFPDWANITHGTKP